MNRTAKAFITDGLLRRALAACRSLGRKEIAVTCGEESRCSLTAFSRYSAGRVVYPSPRKKPDAFIAFLYDYLKKNRHDCLIPMDQNTLSLIVDHYREFSDITALPFPDRDVFDLFHDKGKTMAMAETLGIPIPKTHFIDSPGDLDKLKAILSYPLILKPRNAFAGNGIRHVSDPQALNALYETMHREYPDPLIQAEIPQGEKYSVCCLMDRSANLIASCVVKELRHYPLKDGPSTLQESVWRPDLVEYTAALLKRAGWYGAANADFMTDPRDQTPLLMEINPRFWACLQATIDAGVDFPYLLYQMACGRKVEPVHTYQIGVRCRALIPYDLLHFLSNPNRFRMNPSFFDFSDSRCTYDIISRNDPAPLLGFALSCFRYLFDRDIWVKLARFPKPAVKSAAWPDRTNC